MMKKPTPDDLRHAVHATIPDILPVKMKVLFCGINPGLYSAAIGHHFARPGNRFWPVLHSSGFTPRLYSADEDSDLAKFGYGLTNLIARSSATAAELRAEEYNAGKEILIKKVLKYQPRVLALLGVGMYRQTFQQPVAKVGLQEEQIGQTYIWVLPNPSGLNAHYQISQLTEEFSRLHQWLQGEE